MELLVDDSWIDRTVDVERVLGLPRKEPQPVFRAEAPWESAGIHGFHAVLWDEEETRFKLWYRAATPRAAPGPPVQAAEAESSEQERGENHHFLCYAQSQDGLHWERPILDLYSFQGNRANNILRPIGGRSTVFGSIQKDVNDPDPGRRYKAFEFDHEPAEQVPQRNQDSHGIAVAYSADGLQWGPSKLVMGTSETTDADYLFPGRDPRSGKWVAFMRPRLQPKRRFIGFSESDDFEHWSYPRMLLTPDASDSEYTEFYGLTATYSNPYYVGLLWVYHNNPARSPMTVELVYSRDGRHYRRAMPRTEFLPLGEAGRFDSRMITPIGIVHRENELLIFYNGANHDHGADRGQPMDPGAVDPGQTRARHVGLARIHPQRLCGYAAALDGWVETKFLSHYTGPGPRVVADLGQDGSIHAEILDHYGQVLPGWERERCRPLPQEDGALAFAWGDAGLRGRLDEVSAQGGRVQRVIKLRFHLHRAHLFGFAL